MNEKGTFRKLSENFRAINSTYSGSSIPGLSCNIWGSTIHQDVSNKIFENIRDEMTDPSLVQGDRDKKILTEIKDKLNESRELNKDPLNAGYAMQLFQQCMINNHGKSR